MKTRCLMVLYIFSFTYFATTGTILAETGKQSLFYDRTQQPGWSGSVGLLAGILSSKGSELARDGNERISSLDATPDRNNEIFPAPLGHTSYTFANRTTLSFGGDILDGGGFSLSHSLADETILSLSLPLFLGSYSEVWQDPYLTGQDRIMTDADLDAAFGLSAEYIFGSPFSISYGYSKESVENDFAGESLSARLTSADLKQLRRDNESHSTSLSMTLPLSDHVFLIPSVGFVRTDAEGSANSFTTNGADLTIIYQTDQLEVFGSVYYSDTEYRKVNPVFDTKRKNSSYGVTAGARFLNPLGWENISIDLIFINYRKNSNIHFYDMREDLLAAGLSYHY